MNERERSFWNLTASISFVVFFVFCMWLVQSNDGFTTLARLTFFDFLIVSFATFRLIHLFTYDKIFSFVRNYFLPEHAEDGAPPTRILSRIAYEILECLWCTGIWSGLLILTIYLHGSWGQFIALVLAAAGVGSLLQVISSAIAKR